MEAMKASERLARSLLAIVLGGEMVIFKVVGGEGPLWELLGQIHVK